MYLEDWSLGCCSVVNLAKLDSWVLGWSVKRAKLVSWGRRTGWWMSLECWRWVFTMFLCASLCMFL